MKTAFLPIARAQFIALPRHYASDGFWDGICHVDPDPAGGDVSGGDQGTPPLGGDDSATQIQELQVKLAAKEKALENSRLIERRYRSLEAIVGDTNPEKLQELRDADTRLKQEQSERDRLIMEAKNSVTAEYTGELEALRKENGEMARDRQQVKMTFELFRHFNGAEGDGEQFEGFITLADGLFHRTDSGEIQVKDSSGRLVTAKDEAGNLRPATPKEFMKLLAAGKLDDEFDIKNASLLKMTFAPYNKAMGAGLPSGNAGPMPKDLHALNQSQLGSIVFGL